MLITRDLDFPLFNAPGLPGLLLVRAPYDALRDDILAMVVPAVREYETRLLGRVAVVSPRRVRFRSISDG